MKRVLLIALACSLLVVSRTGAQQWINGEDPATLLANAQASPFYSGFYDSGLDISYTSGVLHAQTDPSTPALSDTYYTARTSSNPQGPFTGYFVLDATIGTSGQFGGTFDIYNNSPSGDLLLSGNLTQSATGAGFGYGLGGFELSFVVSGGSYENDFDTYFPDQGYGNITLITSAFDGNLSDSFFGTGYANTFVPEPSTYGALAGAGLLLVCIGSQFRRKLA